jgi:hypothetical protein
VKGHCVILKIVLIAMALVAAQTCSSPPKSPPRTPAVQVLRAVHNVGGAHYRMVIHRGVWYQAFGSSLLVVDPQQATELKRVAFGTFGEIGPAVDLVAVDNRLWVVIEDDEVVEVSIDVPQLPVIVSRIDAAALGIRPRRLSVVERDVFVSGPGGAVRLRDRQRVVNQVEDALVYASGRQVRRAADNAFVGSASDLQPLPPEFDMPGVMAFIRQGEQSALIGLLSRDVREIDARRATIAAAGVVHSVRAANGKLWVVNSSGVTAYTVQSDSLELALQCHVGGALDVGLLNENYLAVCGTFGRAIYRIHKDDHGSGESFVAVHRDASRLSGAVHDGQHILAGSDEGLWMYLINARVELTTKTWETQRRADLLAPPPPKVLAATINAQAKLSEDKRSVVITPAGSGATTDPRNSTHTYSEPDNGTIYCVSAVDGDFWLGHDRGITVLRVAAADQSMRGPRSRNLANGGAQSAAGKSSPIEIAVAGQLRLPGPVLYIYPLLVGGGASFVSELGGFGVAKFINEPVGTSK